jgi:sugar/nucleoside kinase (ribokinase family)
LTIWLSEKGKSRTCVFDKGDLPSFELNILHEQRIKSAEILMVDGNEMSAAIKGAKIAKENGVKVLYDA